MINDLRFKNKKAAVLGLGVEGQSVVQFLLEYEALVSVFDERLEEEFDVALIADLKSKNIKFTFGKINSLLDADIIIRSPGFKLTHPALVEAKEKNIEITSSTNIFFDHCPGKIIGVTGTKGKGTTSSLIYEMLKKQGYDVYLGGNIGIPALEFINKLKKDSIVVLELSSFQLQDLKKSPHMAVMLMLTSEHLDYHKDTSEYIDAKRNIFRFQTYSDFAIVNRDYPASNESDVHTVGKIFQVSREQGVLDNGCFVESDAVWVKYKGKKVKIIDKKDLLLPGGHNLENVCASVMAALLADVSKENIIKVLKTFRGLEHRLELVKTVGGIRYYNDSFSTTPETAQAAIEAFEEPKIIILGGSSKGSDFSSLGKIISDPKNNVKAIIGIGLEWQRIKSSIINHQSSIKILEDTKDMHEIVQAASQIAELGDIVLLSPACASFDMFKSYRHRGQEFKKEVNAL